MIKVLHWCALRVSDAGRFLADAGERLWELGGNLEGWCDERAYRRKWMRWAKEHNLSVTLVCVPDFDPSEFKIGECVEVKPRPWPTKEDNHG